MRIMSSCTADLQARMETKEGFQAMLKKIKITAIVVPLVICAIVGGIVIATAAFIADEL